MKKAILTLMLLAMATTAFATADNDPDGFGFYFDLGGNEFCTSTATPFQAVTGYLLLTNPSVTTGVSGWECSVVIGGMAPTAGSFAISAGLNVLEAPDFQVGIGTGANALPIAETVLLATYSGYVMDPTHESTFDVRPCSIPSVDPPAPAYVDGEDAGLVISGQSSSGFPYEVNYGAAINGDCGAVANDNVSFGAVKALYN